MPTFKNIRIKMKNGKTRLQRVQVLASGKYKFVKNIVKGKGKTTSKGKSRSASKVSNVGNKGKMFRILGTKGALEDFAWGFGGLTLMGVDNPVALPAIRLVQGVQGHVFNRTGKGRLVYALIDLVDLVIVGQASVQSIFDSIKQLTKIAPMA
ncbi:unnamed protein product [marine sediment metagenome]|uniref:Uncharacterized protein n=1 Tax=marine sediment metagenome TaxID=412755 RepID=X1L706_9ZZZZ